MRHKTAVVCLMAFAALSGGSSVAHAQSFLLDRFDTNKDGNISPDEVPEGTLRKTFDRMVVQYKLDPKKTYTRAEWEKALGISGPSAPASGNNSSGTGSTRPGRGSSRSDASRTPASSRAKSGDDRPYRTLVELPEAYRKHDKDGDGQVGLYEWSKDRIAEFLALDKNADGFLTVEELKKPAPREANKEEKKETKPADRPASDDAAEKPVSSEKSGS